MSFGTLYGFEGNSRSTVLLVLAKNANLDIEFVEVRPPKVDAAYLKLNPLGRVPTFVGRDGFVLTEVMAIAIYFASQSRDTTLFGNGQKDFATVVKWMSFANTEVLPKLGGWFRPLIGQDPYDECRMNASKAEALEALQIMEEHLSHHPFLAGESTTLADLFAASLVSRGFAYVLDREWRSTHPSITRWYETVTSHPRWRSVVHTVVMIDAALNAP
ncbi:hypothetical protein PV08_00565 [Exophiala spinifera]|uniref:Glutathione S-transferase n=1 Tax=Exophiala spinifera TaxID=91928 RepID=A0A0D2BN68_9EURO|nr:uncharacterized protein PV08_00565 [Exophiala spinifera]KIW19990.1 hypothetical protein PV08_00565 [Exophiala spinifera]